MNHDTIPCLQILHSSQSRGWDGIETRLVRIRFPDTVVTTPDHHTITFNLQGRAPIGWYLRGRMRDRFAAPGRVWIVPAGEEHRFRIGGTMENLHWLIRPDDLNRIAEEALGWSGTRVELNPLVGQPEDRLWRLALEMASELTDPAMGSLLYAESLNQAFALSLLRRHSSVASVRRVETPTLSGSPLRRARDFIEENLASDLSLDRIAAEVGLSPWHFAKAFKKAVGRSPHQYVLERRVARARALLSAPDATLASVALEVGFSSASHFSTVFRRVMGLTPGTYRQAMISHPETLLHDKAS